MFLGRFAASRVFVDQCCCGSLMPSFMAKCENQILGTLLVCLHMYLYVYIYILNAEHLRKTNPNIGQRGVSGDQTWRKVAQSSLICLHLNANIAG